MSEHEIAEWADAFRKANTSNEELRRIIAAEHTSGQGARVAAAEVVLAERTEAKADSQHGEKQFWTKAAWAVSCLAMAVSVWMAWKGQSRIDALALRLAQAERRAEQAEQRMNRIEFEIREQSKPKAQLLDQK